MPVTRDKAATLCQAAPLVPPDIKDTKVDKQAKREGVSQLGYVTWAVYSIQAGGGGVCYVFMRGNSIFVMIWDARGRESIND